MFSTLLKNAVKILSPDTIADNLGPIVHELIDENKRRELAWLERSINFSSFAGSLPLYVANQEQLKEDLFRDQNNENKDIIAAAYCITNNTPYRLKLISTNTNLNAAPSHVKSLAPYEMTYFCEKTLTDFKAIGPIHPNNRVHADRFFIYANSVGDEVFLIETDFRLKVSSGYYSSDVKTWNHKVTSVGHTHVDCTSTLKYSLDEAPYSYLVDIQIG